MRVLQVMAGAPQGGAETAFQDIVLALSAAGLSQKVVMRPNNPERVAAFRAAGIPVETLPFGGALDIYTPWKMKRIIADFQPDIVQTWMSRATHKTPHCPAAAAKPYLRVARLGGYYGLKYYKGVDYFIANTPDIRTYLIQKSVDPDHVVTLHNFATEDCPVTTIRRADLDTPEEAKVALALARYHPVKGLDVLIRSVVDMENVHLWLAGEGPEEHNLKALAADLGLAHRVHFLGWRTDRAALLHAADMCIIPSRYEPFGNVFIQAWAHKTPVICSRSQGPLQYVRDGEDGILFDIDSVAQLRAALERLIAHPDQAQTMAEAGYVRYQEEFSRDRVVARYLDFYQKILSAEGRMAA